MTAIVSETVAVAVSPVITLKGRGKAQREMAYMQIAPLSFIENISRVESIANLRTALGASPSEAETKIAQTEWIIGRVASRLPAGEYPKGAADDSAKLEHARALVLHYAAPPKAGSQPRKLRAGQLGRRTDTQHKVIRAAEEAWSLVKAELGLGQAMTQKERNDSKRATNANPVRGDGKSKGADKKTHAPTLSETLPNGGKMKSKADVHRVIDTASATLLALVNKNAGITDLAYSEAVHAFRSAIINASAEAAKK